MTSAGSSLSSSAFATADSGSEYLATAEHYRYLAKGIVDALHRGCLVLVTGDPPANPPMLAAAVREASAPRPVIELPCGPDLDCAQLFGGGAVCSGTSAPVATAEAAGSSALSSPIYLLADADQLTDDQIDELYEAGQATLVGPHGFEAGVLLARSDFITRAESVEPHFSDEGLAGHLRLQRLERDEVEEFIRRQLPTGEGANLFTAQRVALIAITSGGDPAVVNRLARRMFQTEPDVSTPLRVTPRRYAVSLRLPAGIIICLGAAWLVAWGAFERQDLGAYVGLVRDHIMPRSEPAEAPASVAPSPLAAMDSSSVNLVVAPSNAASADVAPSPAAAMDSPSAKVVVAPPNAASEPAPRSGADEKLFSAAEIAALVARGDGFLAAGDIASARLFFERAADSGDGRAAMRMAVSYDAAFLERAGLHGLRGDPEQAAFWYRRARDLGESQAEAAPGGLDKARSAEPSLQSR